MSPELSVKAWHWVCFLMTAPFGVCAIVFPNPERVKFVRGNVAVPLPGFILGFFSSLVHLTVVSHEMISGYFMLALLRDHGFVTWAETDGAAHRAEVYFAVATSAAMFVILAYWGVVCVDPLLMFPVDQMFPKDFSDEKSRALLFQASFGPTDPSRQWQRGMMWFMRYLHTLCPLLLVIDAGLRPHSPRAFMDEFLAGVAFAVFYLCWNFFCWWLLRTPPYPIQKQVYAMGFLSTIAFYAFAVLVVAGLLCVTRWMRSESGAIGVASTALVFAVTLWLTAGIPPFKALVARRCGVDLAELRAVCAKSDGRRGDSTVAADGKEE